MQPNPFTFVSYTYRIEILMMMKEEYSRWIEKILLLFISVAGIIVSIFQFLHDRSLWHDEASLALNLLHRNYFELFSPLDLAQAAPVLFLIIEKLFFQIFPSDMGLRIFPLICFWASIVLFIKVLHRSGLPAYLKIFSLVIFVFSPTLIYFSNEVKPYSTDVFVTLLLFYLYNFDPRNFVKKRFIIAATIALFMSVITPIVLFSITLNAAMRRFELSEKDFNQLYKSLAILLGAFCIYYLGFVHNHPLKEFMVNYWGGLGAFMPANIFSGQFVDFLGYFGLHVFIHLININYVFSAIFLLFFIIGIISILKSKDFSGAALYIGPIIIHLLLSVLKLYPVSQRLILYLMPLFIIIIAKGFDAIIKYLFPKRSEFKWIMTILISIFIVKSFLEKDFPIEKVELKQTLAYISKNAQDGDMIFVCFQAGFPYQYYKDLGHWKDDRFVVRTGSYMLENDTTPLPLNTGQKNNWLIFSDYCKEDEKKMIDEYQKNGFVLSDSSFVTGSRAYKFQHPKR